MKQRDLSASKRLSRRSACASLPRIVLATFPVLASIQQADTNFHLVFFIAPTSVLLQGPPIPWVTRMPELDPSAANSGH